MASRAVDTALIGRHTSHLPLSPAVVSIGGMRAGYINVSDPNFIVFRCTCNLLRIFKDGAHQSKTEFMLGPSSGVNIWIRHILGTQPSSPQSQFEHFSRDTVPLTMFL